ncbi:MAG: hypothetical protein IJ760_04600 [Bacteroidales bacterium]|nr:hypothetical protein [Bacteroidales bacterium]
MKRQKTKKYTLTLSEPELQRLTRYAALDGVSRPTALRRIVSDALRQRGDSASHDERQLGLFDTLQIDIFNNTSKTINETD